MLNADQVAANPAVHFQVESVLPRDSITPAKAYATRLPWHDLDGNDQSKLLLSEPEAVLLVTHLDRRQSSPHTLLRIV
jgi:hypothetical protein